MHRNHARGAALVGLAAIFAGPPAESGSITGRREDQYGDGVHESLIWAVGVGNNPSGAHGIALAWSGNFSINNLPAGQYYLAGNAHFVAPHVILDSPITVPASGSVQANLRDRITMNGQGLTDLDSCRWAAQSFIATGVGLDEVAVVSPDGGSQVSISVREDTPEGRQIGPARIVTNGSLFPAGARWSPGEVPLVPGRRYALRLDGVGGSTWTPAVAYRPYGYPNGHAWFDGVPVPEADLKVAISCLDTGFIEDYSVSNWWRSKTFRELLQTFVPQGSELRVAQMMLAGEGGFVMRAGVHQWSGNYPPGNQVGVAKHAEMSKDLPQAFVWGPGEAPLTPGQPYAVRFTRADGQPFAIYGDSDKYAQGQAYFDGVPEGGIDIDGTFVTREVDRGGIVLSNLVMTPMSGTEVRATFETDAPTTATIACKTGSPPFDTIWPADQIARQSHDVVIRHLQPNTTYDMWVLAHHPDRNVLSTRATPVVVTTRNEFAPFAGRIHGQTGPAAGAEIVLEECKQTTFTDSQGSFIFTSIPTGRHTLRAQAVGYASVVQHVDVTADGQGFADISTTAYTNLLAGSDNNPMAGWTAFGSFNGEFNSGSYSVIARTGPKWMGYVANWPNMSQGEHGGGIFRTMTVEPGRRYRFGGFIRTQAFGSDHDPIDGLAVARIGVDPAAGTDYHSPNVKWARMRFTSGKWVEQTVDFIAEGPAVTLFAHHKWEYFYETPIWYIAAFDDLWLGLAKPAIPDFDYDKDVDQEDFGRFQECLSGAGNMQGRTECALARLDEDEDVDQQDMVVFLACLSGAGQPAPASCNQ